MTIPTIIEAIDNKRLFGAAATFRNVESWKAWRVFLQTLFGLPLSESDLALYRECTGRSTPPTAGFNEAWLVIGRRGGKSFTLALIAVYLAAFKDWRRYLGPGEVGTVMVIAADRKQARTILRYTKGLPTAVPMLRQLITGETTESISLSNRIVIETHTASFRTVRGYTIVAALLDELAFWPTDEAAAEPDVEVINAIRPGMATVPGSMLLCASSPYAQRGALWDAHRRYFGRDDSDVLVWQAATRTMNPSVPQAFIDAEMEKDPAAAAGEYLAQFRTDVAAFVDRKIVEGCVVTNRHELPYATGARYHAFVDPSGGSADSMTLAIAHRDRDGMAVLDAIRERRPPFSPESGVNEFCGVLDATKFTASSAIVTPASGRASASRATASTMSRARRPSRIFTSISCRCSIPAASSSSIIRASSLSFAVARRRDPARIRLTIRPAGMTTLPMRPPVSRWRWRKSAARSTSRRKLSHTSRFPTRGARLTDPRLGLRPSPRFGGGRMKCFF